MLQTLENLTKSEKMTQYLEKWQEIQKNARKSRKMLQNLEKLYKIQKNA